jgi:hypothetical protein
MAVERVRTTRGTVAREATVTALLVAAIFVSQGHLRDVVMGNWLLDFLLIGGVFTGSGGPRRMALEVTCTLAGMAAVVGATLWQLKHLAAAGLPSTSAGYAPWSLSMLGMTFLTALFLVVGAAGIVVEAWVNREA